MNKNILYFLIIIFVSCMIFVFLPKQDISDNKNNEIIGSCGDYQSGEVTIGGKLVKVDIADTDCKRKLGLSGRESLKNEEGMLFVFEKEGNYGFWMRDMNFPIDILWVDNSNRVIGVEKNVSTSTYPNIFGERFVSKYVLEVSSGFSDQNNIKVGNKIIFSEK